MLSTWNYFEHFLAHRRHSIITRGKKKTRREVGRKKGKDGKGKQEKTMGKGLR